MTGQVKEGLTNLSAISLSSFKGVGPSMAEKLAKIGLVSVQDLLFHLPNRYEDRTRITAIRDLLPGVFTNIIGEVTNNQVVQGRRRMMVVPLTTGLAMLIFAFFTLAPLKKIT